jgi:hypothetical protein
MAKNPQDRYQTAGEFAKAIQAVTTGVHKRIQLQNIASAPSNKQTKQSTLQLSNKQLGSPNQRNNMTPDKLPQVNGNKPPIPVDTSKGETALETDPLKRKRRTIPLWAWMISGLVVLVLSLSVFQWSRGGFPFSLLSRSTLIPDNASIQNSPETPSALAHLALGQADKLAFLKESDIWVSDLDGSNLVQLTTDASKKSHLHWSPDGQSILYTSDNCVHMVGLQTKQVLTLTCVSGVPSITAFDISPDGQKVALGLPQSDLYLLPYSQLFHLRQNSLPEDLPALAQCSYYAPYNTGDTLKAANWSPTDDRLAVVVSKLVDGINRDEVNIFDFSQCSATPSLIKEILPTHFLFTLRGYFNRSEISGISWNANDQLLFNGYLSDYGFGDLQLFSLDQNQSQEIAPNGSCCYRDVRWSPDGTYLFYSFQPESGGDISLYYAPTSELDQPGAAMTALALPAGFLGSSLESLQPTLRTIH